MRPRTSDNRNRSFRVSHTLMPGFTRQARTGAAEQMMIFDHLLASVSASHSLILGYLFGKAPSSFAFHTVLYSHVGSISFLHYPKSLVSCTDS